MRYIKMLEDCLAEVPRFEVQGTFNKIEMEDSISLTMIGRFP